MRLKYQLLSIFLLLSALLISLMYGFNSWSFSRGFNNYLNSVELQRLDTVADDLAAGYQQDAGWSEFTRDDARWQMALRAYKQPARRPRPRRTDSGPPPKPRLVLADADRQVLIGPPSLPQNINWRPVSVNGATVGFVGAMPLERLNSDLNAVFARQQRRSYVYSAAGLSLASLVLALIGSHWIVRPILRLQRAVSDLRGGDFTQRIDASRRDELGELARDLNHLAFTLEQNLQARQQWLAEMSHELRTPVAVLRAELEALQDGVIDAGPAAIESLHTEACRLSRLIDDLHELTLADVGALNYQMSAIDLVELIKTRLSATGPVFDNKLISPSFKPDSSAAVIIGDEQRLGQLIDNLIQNSYRYTDSGGQLIIELLDRVGTYQINWQDSAPGVRDDQLPHVFDPLFRADASRSRESGGSGLGLAIARRIVTAHGGTITAGRSRLGGLCVSVSLPKAESPS